MKSAIVLLFAALVLISTAPTSDAVAQAKWDGEYTVTIEYSRASSSNTECSGHLISDAMVVSYGRVTGILRHSDRGAVFLSGEVSDDGLFTAKGSADSAEGNIKGTFTEAGASGTFEETKRTYCDGTWTAVRK